jgi:exonuclease III
MLQHSFNLLGWNVRGLNDQDRRDTVHETIAASSCQIVCLQETKLAVVSPIEAAYIGGYRLKSFAERPAIGTRGGILLLWDESSVQITNVHITEFSLSADVHLPQSSAKGDFKITAVYGPTAANRKDDFFAELVALKPAAGVRWLALGDFNQIRRASDKNKRNIDRSRINRFRDALHDCELSEIRLQNRRFT